MIETIGAKMFWQMKRLVTSDRRSGHCAKPEVILTNVNYMKDPAKEILARKTGKTFTQFKTKKFSKSITCLALYQITTLPKH